MLQQYLPLINSQRIVLASGSPRRREILDKLGLKFSVIESNALENVSKSLPPSQYVLATAQLKLAEVVKRIRDDTDLIIAADTCVHMDGEIFNKPRDAADAKSMLRRFSANAHYVSTGVLLCRPALLNSHCDLATTSAEALRRFTETTRVLMRSMDETMIENYVATGEPLDKAGGYGIQGCGGSLVDAIEGDFYNVMGFPMARFCTELVDFWCRPLMKN